MNPANANRVDSNVKAYANIIATHAKYNPSAILAMYDIAAKAAEVLDVRATKNGVQITYKVRVDNPPVDLDGGLFGFLDSLLDAVSPANPYAGVTSDPNEVSSALVPGDFGPVQLGYETNALDAIAADPRYKVASPPAL